MNRIIASSFMEQFLVIEFSKSIRGYSDGVTLHRDKNQRLSSTSIIDSPDGWGQQLNKTTDWVYKSVDLPYWWRMLEDKEFICRTSKIWFSARMNQLSDSKLNQTLANISSMLSEAQKRDDLRYRNWNSESRSTFSEEISLVSKSGYFFVLIFFSLNFL